MNCIRCGKETEGKAVFCPDCLEEMARYPVKPGTIVHIPQHREQETRKQVKKRREQTPEEQLNSALGLIQTLVVALLGTIGALIVTGLLLVYTLTQSPGQAPGEETQPPAGRNYTSVTPAED